MDHPRRSWSDLPVEILHLFLDRLYFADHQRFAAVCKPWCSAVARHRSPPTPLLVLTDDDDLESLLLLSPAEDGKIHSLELPDYIDTVCCGSSFGWLFMENDILFNPLTKQQIELPQSFIPDHRRSLESNVAVAVSMSSTAATVGGGTFASLRASSELAFCRLGDETWSDFPDLQFSDFLFREGLLYCIDSLTRLFVLELGANPKIKEHFHPTLRGTRLCPSLELVNLVPRGEELLMVIDHPEISPVIRRRTHRFHVFRLNPSRTEWVPLKSLDGWILFLSTGSSFALEASKYPAFKPNCIMFSDYHGCYLFFLEDGSIQTYHHFGSESRHSTYQWLLHSAA